MHRKKKFNLIIFFKFLDDLTPKSRIKKEIGVTQNSRMQPNLVNMVIQRNGIPLCTLAQFFSLRNQVLQTSLLCLPPWVKNVQRGPNPYQSPGCFRNQNCFLFLFQVPAFLRDNRLGKWWLRSMHLSQYTFVIEIVFVQ